MTDLAPPDPATQVAEPGASVVVVENPHTDDATVAWSAVDAAKRAITIGAGELDRMKSKLERAQADVASAQQYVDDAVAAAADRQSRLDAALATLDSVKTANPDLAAEVQSRRDAAAAARRAELEAELAELGS